MGVAGVVDIAPGHAVPVVVDGPAGGQGGDTLKIFVDVPLPKGRQQAGQQQQDKGCSFHGFLL